LSNLAKEKKMADVLKVFVNVPNQTVTPSIGAVTIDLLTTTAGQTAVVKDLDFAWTDLSPYKRKGKVLLDGYPLSEFDDSAGFSAVGSQIMNESSTVSLQIELEAPVQTFAKVKGFFERPNDMLLIDYTYDPAIDALANFTAMYNSGTAQAKNNHTSVSRSTCSFYRNNAPVFATSSGTQQIFLMNESQAQIFAASWAGSIPCNAIAADETYIYGVNNSADTILRRFNHQTLATATSLTLSTTVTGFNSSNQGFVALHGDELFIKASGGNNNFQIINTTTGVVTTVTDSAMAEGSTRGGAVTVTKEGRAYLVVAMAQNAMLYDLATGALTFEPLLFGSSTTTFSNQVINIGEGLVLVNNNTFGTVMIIDVSSGVMVQTLVSSFADLDTDTEALMSMAGLTADRSLSYGTLISGVETT
jgi:hypothetical protein